MDDFLKRLKDIKIQGAINIAVESLYYLKRFAKKHGFGREFDIECRKLMQARPTAVPLYNVINEIKKKRTIKAIDNIISQIKKSQKIITEKGRRIFRKKSFVMTHCHSHEAIALMIRNKDKIKEVYVTETRPKYQGVLTAKDLRNSGINVKFITDSAADFYINNADMVIVGCDSIRRNGFINKIGTLELAVLAREFGKPFYVVSSTYKLDKRKNIKIEMRKPSEVAEIRNVKILNPAFVLTPWKYVTAVVTEKGLMKPEKLRKLL